METLPVTKTSTAKKTASTGKKRPGFSWLLYLFYPIGLVKIWRSRSRWWAKLTYTVVGLPLFVIGFAYVGIVLFAAFLPPLDRSVGHRTDRTIVNGEGHYAATFVKTAAETGGAYELVKVDLEPFGGNDWHYHNRFEESFTVLEGSVRIGTNGDEKVLEKGETATAQKKDLHFFKNNRAAKSVLLVKVSPAAGLEKTLRVAYGLINDGQLKNDMTENPWHMALLLGYSESYLPVLPAWFQEPLIQSLARIAQWKGEDKELYTYFR